mmetsp:Transcript_58295/g.103544  ORF Transcript_58295/g.103544 Transcript_58295/m.103544 type:complete len:289 (-) Transcript_58295:74-940(-)
MTIVHKWPDSTTKSSYADAEAGLFSVLGPLPPCMPRELAPGTWLLEAKIEKSLDFRDDIMTRASTGPEPEPESSGVCLPPGLPTPPGLEPQFPSLFAPVGLPVKEAAPTLFAPSGSPVKSAIHTEVSSRGFWYRPMGKNLRRKLLLPADCLEKENTLQGSSSSHSLSFAGADGGSFSSCISCCSASEQPPQVKSLVGGNTVPLGLHAVCATPERSLGEGCRREWLAPELSPLPELPVRYERRPRAHESPSLLSGLGISAPGARGMPVHILGKVNLGELHKIQAGLGRS